MNHKIAIHPDRVRHKNGELQSYSERWVQLAHERGIAAVLIDTESADFLSELRSCNGLLWRFGYDPYSLKFAKNLIPAIEHGMGIHVFPSWETSWHFEDKIAQHYLMKAAGIPSPDTWVFYNRDAALEFCRNATYPVVAKLASGVQSANVQRLDNFGQARDLIRRVFGAGVVTLQPGSLLQRAFRHRWQALRLLAGKPIPSGIQHNYLYAQEFLKGNNFDTRVTVIGNRAFAFRRFNRPGDFRASGSGRIDWDPMEIDRRMILLGFDIAKKLNTQSIAIDGLQRRDECVVGEISYTYASWAVRDCPGHWKLETSAKTGQDELVWVDGKLRPEDAIFDDFIAALDEDSRRPARAAVARQAAG